MILIAAIVFSLAERVNIIDSLWWAFVTAFTVGYGDLYPHTLVGKVDAVFLMSTVTLIILPLIVGHTVTKLVKNKDEFTHVEQEDMKRDIARIKELLERR